MFETQRKLLFVFLQLELELRFSGDQDAWEVWEAGLTFSSCNIRGMEPKLKNHESLQRPQNFIIITDICDSNSKTNTKITCILYILDTKQNERCLRTLGITIAVPTHHLLKKPGAPAEEELCTSPQVLVRTEFRSVSLQITALNPIPTVSFVSLESVSQLFMCLHFSQLARCLFW